MFHPSCHLTLSCRSPGNAFWSDWRARTAGFRSLRVGGHGWRSHLSIRNIVSDRTTSGDGLQSQPARHRQETAVLIPFRVLPCLSESILQEQDIPGKRERCLSLEVLPRGELYDSSLVSLWSGRKRARFVPCRPCLKTCLDNMIGG